MNSHRKLVLRLLKRHDGTRHDDDVCVFLRCFPVSPCQSDSLNCGKEAVFWGKVHWSLVREGWLLQWFIFITNTWWVKIFCRWQTPFFGQKCDQESVGWAGRQTGERTLLHIYLRYFFPHISQSQRQLKLLHYFVWSCLWEMWRTRRVNEGPIDTPSICKVSLSIHTGLVLR